MTRARRPVWRILALALTVGAVLALWSDPSGLPNLRLTVADADRGRVLLQTRIRPGTTLELAYTHSMFGGRVREQYHVHADGQLRLLAMVTDHAGAAEYYARYGAFHQGSDGRYYVQVPEVTPADLRVQVDVIGRPTLAVPGQSWGLHSLASGVVIITVQP